MAKAEFGAVREIGVSVHQGQLRVVDVGVVPYGQALDVQLRLVEARRLGEIPDTLLFVEHPPVVTLGRAAKATSLLTPKDHLAKQGVELFEITRGGDVTFHGPGQVVGYPIIDLNARFDSVHRKRGRDLHQYLRDLEEVLLQTLAAFGLKGERQAGFTGAWVNNRKIVAIGVAVKHWISYHGFAFNVNVDLNYFNLIVPCGLAGKEVTSLERELGRPVSMEETKANLSKAFAQVFEKEIVSKAGEELAERVKSPSLLTA